MAGVGMVIAQLMCLSGDGIGDRALAIARVHAIEPGEPVEEPVAVTVDDVTALGPLDDPRRAFAARMLRQMCGRVKEILAVPFVQYVVRQHVARPSMRR